MSKTNLIQIFIPYLDKTSILTRAPQRVNNIFLKCQKNIKCIKNILNLSSLTIIPDPSELGLIAMSYRRIFSLGAMPNPRCNRLGSGYHARSHSFGFGRHANPRLVVAIMSDLHLGLTPNMAVNPCLGLAPNMVARSKTLRICVNNFLNKKIEKTT